jgi:transcriptional regulator with XRE-family HTH domain
MARIGASIMIGIVSPLAAAARPGESNVVRFCAELYVCYSAGSRTGVTMPAPDKQLSAEQSRQIAETIREEIARRRISRQSLAEQAKLSLSTLEKVLGGRRPFTLATTVRLEQALGVSLRKVQDVAAAPINGDVAPDNLGAYSRRAVAWIEGTYLTVRPSFGDRAAIYVYHTEIAWDAAASSLLFREGEKLDVAFTHSGEVSVPNKSGFIYLVTNRHGQHRLITVSRPTITGEMYGIITTLLAGRGSLLTPIAAPIAFLPIQNIPRSTVGRISPSDANYAIYREHLRRTIDEPFALFLQG